MELKNKEGNDVSLARDLESNCDITISVSCCISSNTNDTRSILVSILPYLMSGMLKMMQLCIYNSRVTWKVTVMSRFP